MEGIEREIESIADKDEMRSMIDKLPAGASVVMVASYKEDGHEEDNMFVSFAFGPGGISDAYALWLVEVFKMKLLGGSDE